MLNNTPTTTDHQRILKRIAESKRKRSPELDLTGLQVSSIPKELEDCIWIEHLNLRYTQVSDISALQHVPLLTQLDLGDTQVSDLSALQHLPMLTRLNLSRTQVSDISALQHLPLLIQLVFSSTQVSNLSALQHLPRLTQLVLNSTQVSDLSALQHVPRLTHLRLNSTQVSDLSALQHVPLLTQLNLDNTQVPDLSVLQHVPLLTQLNLDNTQVSDLSALQHVPLLTQLNLDNTQVSDLSALQHVPLLTQLNLGDTQVSDLSALQHVPLLTQLNLNSTQVSDLSALQHIPLLTQLYLSDTQVSDFPSELYQSSLNCYPNYKSWKKDMDRGHYSNRLFKLQICGNGTVGKTKIVEHILTGEYKEGGNSTDGIQIYITQKEKSWAKNHDPIRLMIWDFGGQEIYHQTHRLFLRDRSVYFLVYDEETYNNPSQEDRKTRQMDENRPLSYWISDIYTTAPNANIILVQNKMDLPGSIEIDIREQVPEEFNLGRPIRVSAKTSFRFDELMAEMHNSIRELPSFKMKIPSSWWKVREAILKNQQTSRKRKRIPISLFYRLCRLYNLCQNSEEALLTYLDGLGVILYDKKLFPEQIITDQQWALDAVYAILQRFESTQVLTEKQDRILAFQESCGARNGQFIAKRLPFDKQQYSPEERRLFLNIMLRSGICFQTNASQGGDPVYVLFHFLRKGMPDVAKDYWSLAVDGKVHYQRYINQYHLHKGIFRELVKRISDHVSLHYLWQDGLLIRWHGKTDALLTTNYQKKYLEVKATGHYSLQILEAFRNALDEILISENFFQQQLSSNGETFFTKEAIQEGLKTEASKIRDVDGNLNPDWQHLKWCLKEDRDISFEKVPVVRHEVQDLGGEPNPQFDKAAWIENIQDLISRGKMSAVFKELRPITKTEDQDFLTLQQRRYAHLEGEHRAGLIKPDDADLRRKRIADAIVFFVRELAEDDSSTFISNSKVLSKIHEALSGIKADTIHIRNTTDQIEVKLNEMLNILLAEVDNMKMEFFINSREQWEFFNKLDPIIMALTEDQQPADPDWYNKPIKEKLKITLPLLFLKYERELDITGIRMPKKWTEFKRWFINH